MADQATALDAKRVLIGLMQIKHKKTPTITEPKDIDLMDRLIRQAMQATGARTRSVQLNSTLESAASAAERPSVVSPIEIKVLGITDHLLKPTEKLQVVAQGECPGVAGTIVDTEEEFVLLPDGEGLIMVIFPKVPAEA